MVAAAQRRAETCVHPTDPGERAPCRLSPDGKWIAYASDESGREEVYVQAFPTGSKWPVSNRGGSHPRWRADGRELFYLGPGRSSIMAATVRWSGPAFESDAPRQVITLTAALPALVAPYDVSRDGSQFLVLEPAESPQEPTPLTVVVNWQARLKRW